VGAHRFARFLRFARQRRDFQLSGPSRRDAFRRQRGTPSPIQAKEAELRSRIWGTEAIFYEKNLAELEAAKLSLYSAALRENYDEFDFTRSGVIDPGKLQGIHPLHQRSYLDLKLRLGAFRAPGVRPLS
jgi:asparagine synthase (glutamine-hydrolysing)